MLFSVPMKFNFFDNWRDYEAQKVTGEISTL